VLEDKRERSLKSEISPSDVEIWADIFSRNITLQEISFQVLRRFPLLTYPVLPGLAALFLLFLLIFLKVLRL
jgi:hypothetical protein